MIKRFCKRIPKSRSSLWKPENTESDEQPGQEGNILLFNRGLLHRTPGTAILTSTTEFKKTKGQRKSEDYYEFQQIIQYIDSYLVDYPNETDYWEILNTNLATSLITDKIPTAWDTTKLAKSVAELTVDIEVHAGSGGAAYTRTSSVTVKAPNKKTDSATTPNGFVTHAEKARLRDIGDGGTQLTLTGLEPVDWMHPPDDKADRRWNGRRLARHWDELPGSHP